ncbi:MAG: isoprenylcysteine carboxylmethyltransferase family protein [Alphaproteobacteria bacterium]|nr:isoprenylcysteine carboxylmethyltransferase family protein [Alphaproteobacteria bacterium]
MSEPEPPWAARVGARLFAWRGWVPVPLLLAAVALALPSPRAWALGGLVVLLGEALRLWGVAHIGPASRTRSAEVVPLVDTGPFAFSRNPLYIGNLTMWAGLGLMTGRPWVAPALVLPLLLHYQLVVRWEEHNLSQRLGAPYRAYLERAPRWLGWPRWSGGGDWTGALRSERSTFIVMGLGVGLLIGRASWG